MGQMDAIPTVADRERTESPLAGDADARLLRRFARGELAAFDELYRRNEVRVWRFIRRSVADAATADEVFQDTWLRVIAQAPRFQPLAAFSTWLFTIARNRVVDLARTRRPQATLEAAGELVDATPGPEQSAIHDQQGERLLAAFAKLPDEQREAFLLQVEGGLSVAQVAEATGVATETAKSRLRYARAALRTALGGMP